MFSFCECSFFINNILKEDNNQMSNFLQIFFHFSTVNRDIPHQEVTAQCMEVPKIATHKVLATVSQGELNMDPTQEGGTLLQAAIPTPHNSSNNLARRLDHMAHHKEAQHRLDLIHRMVQLELSLQDRTLPRRSRCRLIQQRRVDTPPQGG